MSLTAIHLTALVAADLPQPIEVNELFGGIQAVFRFPNDHGASVINHIGSYGVELAVLRFYGESASAFDLDFSTPVAGDVVGRIKDTEELIELLREIRDLPAPSGDPGDPDGSAQTVAEAVESLGRMVY